MKVYQTRPVTYQELIDETNEIIERLNRRNEVLPKEEQDGTIPPVKVPHPDCASWQFIIRKDPSAKQMRRIANTIGLDDDEYLYHLGRFEQGWLDSTTMIRVFFRTVSQCVEMLGDGSEDESPKDSGDIDIEALGLKTATHWANALGNDSSPYFEIFTNFVAALSHFYTLQKMDSEGKSSALLPAETATDKSA